jgi:hypothetical protein
MSLTKINSSPFHPVLYRLVALDVLCMSFIFDSNVLIVRFNLAILSSFFLISLIRDPPCSLSLLSSLFLFFSLIRDPPRSLSLLLSSTSLLSFALAQILLRTFEPSSSGLLVSFSTSLTSSSSLVLPCCLFPAPI